MIYIDMDGVLCDLVRQVEAFTGVTQIYNESNYGQYHIQAANPEISEEELFSFFSQYEFWSEMFLFDWTAYVLSWAERTGKDVYILSRPWLFGGDEAAEACLQGKVAWIKEHFPEYLGKLLFVDRKEDFAAPDAILVDDNMENCMSFAAAGGKTIFLPTPWGDVDYGLREKKGFALITEVLRCELNTVESM